MAELPALTVADLCREAGEFAEIESAYDEPSLYGVDHGKNIGTIAVRAENPTRLTPALPAARLAPAALCSAP